MFPVWRQPQALIAHSSSPFSAPHASDLSLAVAAGSPRLSQSSIRALEAPVDSAAGSYKYVPSNQSWYQRCCEMSVLLTWTLFEEFTVFISFSWLMFQCVWQNTKWDLKVVYANMLHFNEQAGGWKRWKHLKLCLSVCAPPQMLTVKWKGEAC